MDVCRAESLQEDAHAPTSQAQPDEMGLDDLSRFGIKEDTVSWTRTARKSVPSIGQNGASEDAKDLLQLLFQQLRMLLVWLLQEITEVRDFAGEEIEVKKLIDADSKEATEKGKGAAGATCAVDAVLEQIKKKPKLSVLDKTKKDWGEFKDENKGMEDELDAYKKSSNQYLDKVSFLQRADYREFERKGMLALLCRPNGRLRCVMICESMFLNSQTN
ncbi:hypothetical protein DH2020_041123 [Rehmannia glutinosa]|uniref:BCNT-C domain-containing protein n=1 Tax=Rehmannia glutinosa TaxID=99300 RepID=A0ABR0USK9_REHGL